LSAQKNKYLTREKGSARQFNVTGSLKHFSLKIDKLFIKINYMKVRKENLSFKKTTVLHLEFQNYGGLSPTQLKNVGDLKKMWGTYIDLTI
jgi:hypothetical protein